VESCACGFVMRAGVLGVLGAWCAWCVCACSCRGCVLKVRAEGACGGCVRRGEDFG
jgi:hypothetical protein